MGANIALQRRQFLGAAGLGLAAAPFAPAAVQAQASAVAPSDIVRTEFWVKKGDVKLYMSRKQLAAPSATGSRPVLFFVHGSSNASGTSWDLNVPGQEYSIMNVFARWGYDTWTMDHEGYGHSDRTSGNSDIASGVEDLKVAFERIVAETGRQKLHVFGTSSGALRAGAYAMVRPERIDRLVLSAFTYKGDGAPTLQQRAKRVDEYRTNNTRLRDREMVRSIFTRDGLASSYDMKVADIMADEEMKFGDRVPTGTYLDMTANLPVVDPLKVMCPVLMVRGDHDGISTDADLLEFFRQLPNGDRQYIVLPETAHNPVFAKTRAMYWHVTRAFLTMADAQV
ncbi:MAG: alpha/beta hydrolase [Hyphomicrobiales bacterium]|nr:alpha/beta hydrolase [Hyphomicrobiales bacterium]